MWHMIRDVWIKAEQLLSGRIKDVQTLCTPFLSSHQLTPLESFPCFLWFLSNPGPSLLPPWGPPTSSAPGGQEAKQSIARSSHSCHLFRGRLAFNVNIWASMGDTVMVEVQRELLKHRGFAWNWFTGNGVLVNVRVLKEKRHWSVARSGFRGVKTPTHGWYQTSNVMPQSWEERQREALIGWWEWKKKQWSECAPLHSCCCFQSPRLVGKKAEVLRGEVSFPGSHELVAQPVACSGLLTSRGTFFLLNRSSAVFAQWPVGLITNPGFLQGTVAHCAFP